MGLNETRPRIIQTYRLLFLTCFTNATQITEAAQRPKAPALLPVFLITLMFCNARLIGMCIGVTFPIDLSCDSHLCCQLVLLSRLEVKFFFNFRVFA